MLRDWIYWLTSLPQHELWVMLAPLFIFDAPRYLIGGLSLWVVDSCVEVYERLTGRFESPQYTYCPSVCVIVAGLNEADSLAGSLEVLYGTYPRLEILVVDDGSDDDMTGVANAFSRTHEGVSVLTKPRGGKSSGMNAALPLTDAEVLVILDADSELSPTAIWEIVQPLADPKVGGVSGNVLVRNSTANLVARIQAFEYLRSILLGRMVSSRLGLLGIVSGAFGAFRRETLVRVGGWDVGPGEDEDIVLRLRKLGYRIEFAPYAECYTDAPTSWKVLTKQRRRWEWAVVTFESRKHIDLAKPWMANFRFGNFMLVFERWVFNLFLPLWFWVYLGWLLVVAKPDNLGRMLLLYYFMYTAIEYMQWLLVLFYSNHKRRDAKLWLLPPIMPFYMTYQRCVTSFAILEEIFTRRSFRDSFVPDHVRKVTWHW